MHNKNDIKKVVIEIIKPSENPYKKFLVGTEALAKALKVKGDLVHEHSKSEPTPYRALRELADEISERVSLDLNKMYYSLCKHLFYMEKAKGDFTFKGKVYINPKTGNILTKKDWDSIAQSIDAVFGKIYGQTEESLIKRALALGKILNGMDTSIAVNTPLSAINFSSATLGKIYDSTLEYAKIHTGELIQDITSKNRKAVAEVIVNGCRDNLSAKEIEEKLFEEFSELNRDWRRIAETETAINFNNGYLVAEKEAAKGENIFMIGVSGAEACDFCNSEVNGRVVILLDSAPDNGSDQVNVDGKQYTAIWPNKTNFGRNRRDWWVASGSQHPHCRCTWVRYNPEFEEDFNALKDALNKLK